MNGVGRESASLLWLPREAHRELLPATGKHALTARSGDWATDLPILIKEELMRSSWDEIVTGRSLRPQDSQCFLKCVNGFDVP